jgi:gluconolactonase
MRKHWLALFFVTGFACLVFAQAAPSVVRLDPALDEIVAPTAKVETIKGEKPDNPPDFAYFGSLEGPVWVSDAGGYLLCCDIPANAIYKYTPSDRKLSVFMNKAGYAGTDLNNTGMIVGGRITVLFLGPSGLALDPQGRVVMATLGGREVARIERDGTRTVLADRYEGKRLNGPNDLAIRSDGSIYFSDMYAGLRGGEKSTSRELPYNGVFVLKDQRLRLIDMDPFGIVPNGITLSPDEKVLYAGGGKKIVRYDLQSDGMATNGRVFVDMTSDTAPGNVDGLHADAQGNVWSTGPGGLWIMSGEGKHLGTIRPPEGITNFTFGDADGKTVYMTNRTNLYRVRINRSGLRARRVS